MGNLLSFISGSILGMYIAQNYEIPNVKKSSLALLKYLKSLEKSDDE